MADVGDAMRQSCSETSKSPSMFALSLASLYISRQKPLTETPAALGVSEKLTTLDSGKIVGKKLPRTIVLYLGIIMCFPEGLKLVQSLSLRNRTD